MNNPPPSPTNRDADIDSDINTEPLNSAFTEPVDSNWNIPPSSRDAVTEPVAILSASNAKLAIEIFVKPLPSPLITPPTFSDCEISTEPLNSDLTPSVGSSTINLPSSLVDAVTEPVTICATSNAKLASEIFVRPEPSPVIIPPKLIDSDTFSEPLNSVVTEDVDSTLKNPSLVTDAVTEPVTNLFTSNDKFANEMLVN